MPENKTLTWDDLTKGRGIPNELNSQPGLYYVYDGDGALLYIGKSTVLGRRLGQLIGAICGAWGLHPGGRRIWESWDELVHPLKIRFAVGEAAASSESDEIVRLAPRFNLTYVARGKRGYGADPE